MSSTERQKKTGLAFIQFIFGWCIRRSINRWSFIIRFVKRMLNITRVTNKAVNILEMIPSIRTIAKPFISSEATQ
ncbi:hypothetical protein ES703_57643 [subsurface metagenome]